MEIRAASIFDYGYAGFRVRAAYMPASSAGNDLSHRGIAIEIVFGGGAGG